MCSPRSGVLILARTNTFLRGWSPECSARLINVGAEPPTFQTTSLQRACLREPITFEFSMGAKKTCAGEPAQKEGASRTTCYGGVETPPFHTRRKLRASFGAAGFATERVGSKARGNRALPHSAARLLPVFDAAATLSRQELDCCSCHTSCKRFIHVWTLKMGHN